MIEYEYKTLYRGLSSSTFEERLNELASEGWRLVPVAGGSRACDFIMEREVAPPPNMRTYR